MITVEKYRASKLQAWDRCVDSARNGLFIFKRNYMDYHAHRYHDHSLLFYEDGQLLSILPANVIGDVLWSHSGLTFGSVLSPPRITQRLMLELFDAFRIYARGAGFKAAALKPSPYIFHSHPAQEDLCALMAYGGRLCKRTVSTVINLQSRIRLSKGRRLGMRSGGRAGLIPRKMEDVHPAMNLLEEVLKERHSAVPTHSEHELSLLLSRFPQNIEVYGAWRGGELLSSAVIFKYGGVAHTQYLASGAEGRSCGALDFLITWLLDDVYRELQYFSMGTSSEGDSLNYGLLAYKEMFGGRSIAVDQYYLPLS
jgi:hypothetical protein